MLKQVRRGPHSGGKPLVLWPRRSIPLLLCGALLLPFCGVLPLLLLETPSLFFCGAFLLSLGAFPPCRALLLLVQLCGALPLPLEFGCALSLPRRGALLLLVQLCGALPPSLRG